MTEQEFWIAIRQALLMLLDAIERWRQVKPRTAEIRKAARKERKDG